MDDFVTLSGDLLFERKKLSESLKRLETIISSPALTGQLGSQNLIQLQSEMDHISHGMYRLDALARMLSLRAQNDGFSSSESFLQDALSRVRETSEKLGRVLQLKPLGTQSLIDRYKLELFKPIFFEMLDTFIEFSTESPRERLLRGKKEAITFRLNARKGDDGVQLTIIADGNGLIPPLMDKHGEFLARIGIRASFEGKPGQWSCWIFHIPTASVISNCIKARFGNNCIYIPGSSVVSIKKVSDFKDIKLNPQQIFMLSDDLERYRFALSADEYESQKKIIEVAAGIHKIWLVVDQADDKEEVFMKPLLGSFTGQGRFVGVVVEAEQGEQMLNIVMNPSYLVYGLMTNQGELHAV